MQRCALAAHFPQSFIPQGFAPLAYLLHSTIARVNGDPLSSW
jgi:hypothetical protein